MPLYDLMLLLDPGVPSDRQESILRDVQTQLESGGNVVGTYDWGTRRMTFEIDHRPEAAYHLFQFETEGGGALLERVDHSLKIMDGVLRHRIIRLKDGAPVPPMPQPERRGGYEEYTASDSAAAADGAPAADAAPAETAAAEAAPAADAPAETTSAEATQAAEAPAESVAPAEAAQAEPAADAAEPAAEQAAPAEPAAEATDAPADTPSGDEAPGA
jgi:ribosomal protein S6